MGKQKSHGGKFRLKIEFFILFYEVMKYCNISVVAFAHYVRNEYKQEAHHVLRYAAACLRSYSDC